MATTRKPVYADPEVLVYPTGVRWDLSRGCALFFKRDPETGELYAYVTVSGRDQRNGYTARAVTRKQIAAFARMLDGQLGSKPGAEDDVDVPALIAEVERLRQLVDEFGLDDGDEPSDPDEAMLGRLIVDVHLPAFEPEAVARG